MISLFLDLLVKKDYSIRSKAVSVRDGNAEYNSMTVYITTNADLHLAGFYIIGLRIMLFYIKYH